MNRSVEIVDVTLRDGLQMLSPEIRLEDKLYLLVRAGRAGLKRLELGSFVSSRLLPQFADTAAVVMAASAVPGLRGSVLVPNVRGFQRAAEAGAREIVWVVSASEAHNRSNLRRSVAQSLDELRQVTLDALGAGIHVRLAIATAFHCPFEGPVPHTAVLRILEAGVERFGVTEVVLADTIGHAFPHEVSECFSVVRRRYPELLLGFHAHDTRGRGIANVAAAFAAGCSVFDAAFAGLGGCPYAPGASGNVSTEDVARYFLRRGLPIGLDPHELEEAANVARRFASSAPAPAADRSPDTPDDTRSSRCRTSSDAFCAPASTT